MKQKQPDEDRQLLGEILVERNYVTEEQLLKALKIQSERHSLLGEIFVEQGLLDERDIVAALIVQCNLPYIAINKYQIEQDVLGLIPVEMARENHLIPLDRVGGVLSVVMADPINTDLNQKLEDLTGMKVAPFIATKAEIDNAITRCYKDS